ncbi:hypothetical protein FF38_07196 [Lucilia cuprina]|uniref:Chitin-binding type-2 domain-containing protein n=1 Tax=Lucilia cuprina TaxID=7375 RepID=A0A0L0CL56_LUCCU|nr:hypothetical protein FF38_07196 [Lucilia cuprina]
MDLNLFILFLNGLLLFSPICWAQSGYNYGRSEIAGGNIPATAAAPIRPLTGGFAPASAATAAFPTAPTAFSGVGGAASSPSGPFGGFSAQNQRGIGGLTGSGPTAYGGTAANLPKRPNLSQRPTGTGGTGPGSIYAPNTQFSNTGTGRGSTGTGNSIDDDYDGDFSAIPGVPGVDYPIYSQVPQTNFDCAQQPLPGYYSDIEAQCQVFHICALNRTYSFLCPNGTIFSQEVLVCIWWNQYDCASAPSLYANNAFIYDYGNERIPTNTGYQPSSNQQIGRPQTNILSSSGARAPPSTTGLFTSQRIPSSVTGGGGNIAIQPSSLSGVAANANRFNPSATNAGAQTFPATPTPFGSVLRPASPAVATTPGGGGGGSGYNANLPETAFGNAAIATPTTKAREYLPPPSRRQ